eukprot:Em0007g1555a
MAAFITMNRRNDQSGNDNELNQLIISTTAAAEENDVSDSDFTNSSDNESEDEQTLNKAAASSVEDDHPEQAVVVTAATEEDDPLLIYKDVGYINFSATGQASIGQLLKEAMVRQGYDCFKNADANFAKEEFGSKATVRDKKVAAGYEEIILKKLKDDDLKFSDCRAQMYDNAAVMSGHISGVQARLTNLNAKAIFVNCENHSLNLAGVHAASVDPLIITFFGTVEQVYVFISGSTIRWKKMEEKLNFTVKRESDTRWSARESAVRTIVQSYDDIIELLQEMSEDALQFADTREKAGTLLNSLLTLSFVCFLILWEQVLHKINVVQKPLQSPRMNLREAAADLDSLINHFINKRSELCQNAYGAPLQTPLGKLTALPQTP